jgi:hypothetical protein
MRKGKAMIRVLQGLNAQDEVLYSDFHEKMADDRP